MNKTVSVAIVAVIVLIVGGVYLVTNNSGGDNSKNTNDTSASMTPMPSAKQAQTSNINPQSTDKVTIQNFVFGPQAITVKKGTTVTWTNQDSAVHTVTETDGQSGPKSQNLDKGQSYTFTFDSVGTFKYGCSIHTSMTGTVIVTE